MYRAMDMTFWLERAQAVPLPHQETAGER